MTVDEVVARIEDGEWGYDVKSEIAFTLYEEGATQEQIAEGLGETRHTVQRMIGWVLDKRIRAAAGRIRQKHYRRRLIARRRLRRGEASIPTSAEFAALRQALCRSRRS